MGQHLLYIGYVSIHTCQRGLQRLRHHLQLVSGVQGKHLGVQIAVGEGPHPVRHAPHRMGDGPGKAQDHQYGDGQTRQSGQN